LQHRSSGFDRSRLSGRQKIGVSANLQHNVLLRSNARGWPLRKKGSARWQPSARLTKEGSKTYPLSLQHRNSASGSSQLSARQKSAGFGLWLKSAASRNLLANVRLKSVGFGS
jgi:hypothetical protein